jgi:hypothetical protein
MRKTPPRGAVGPPPTDRAAAAQRRNACVAAAGLAMLAALGFAWWQRSATDPRMVEIRTLQGEIGRRFADTGGPTTLVEAAQAASELAHVRRQVLALPANLRLEAETHGQTVFLEAVRGRVTRYFALSPEARRIELDRQIRQDELLRQAFSMTEAVGSVFGAIAGGPSADGRSKGSTKESSKESTATVSGHSDAAPGDPTEWLRVMIDRTSPMERATYIEYRRVKDQRRVELGLPPLGNADDTRTGPVTRR